MTRLQPNVLFSVPANPIQESLLCSFCLKPRNSKVADLLWHHPGITWGSEGSASGMMSTLVSLFHPVLNICFWLFYIICSCLRSSLTPDYILNIFNPPCKPSLAHSCSSLELESPYLSFLCCTGCPQRCTASQVPPSALIGPVLILHSGGSGSMPYLPEPMVCAAGLFIFQPLLWTPSRTAGAVADGLRFSCCLVVPLSCGTRRFSWTITHQPFPRSLWHQHSAVGLPYCLEELWCLITSYLSKIQRSREEFRHLFLTIFTTSSWSLEI